MTIPTIDANVYQAAHETAVLTNFPNLNLLKFSGETRLDLLNRMSTQAVLDLKAGEGAATILTTDVGRIIDRLILYVASQDVYALTGDNHADNIARYLLHFVFFNDDFHIENISAQWPGFGVYGPQAGAKLADAGFPVTDLPLHHWREDEIAGVETYLHARDPIAGGGYLILCAAKGRDVLWQHLVDSGLFVADAEAYETLRIEAGHPRFGHELTQNYIPLEANLWDDVSFNKGCYIGQEIIARLESRNRLAKKLVKLMPTASVAAGSQLTANGKNAGTLTSVAQTPHGFVALGYVKTAVLEAGSELVVGETAVHL
ncbi:MAG: glycine cleavage system protein T [Chloroflexi bacterium]|nr:MAG: glycine cleavage system protein T [Chloroflexota bacterium]